MNKKALLGFVLAPLLFTSSPAPAQTFNFFAWCDWVLLGYLSAGDDTAFDLAAKLGFKDALTRKKSTAALQNEFASSGQGITDFQEALTRRGHQHLSDLLASMRPFLESKLGWDEFYDAFRQFVAEKGAWFSGTTDSLVYLPGPSPDVLLIKGQTTSFSSPQKMVEKLTGRKDLVLENIRIEHAFRSTRFSVTPMMFSAEVRLPN